MSRGDALPRLTSLRSFAAAAVVVFHLDAWDVASLPGGVSELGYVGVAFFFVLSGMVLAWGTDPRLPARTFYRRRFARVWPSHAVMLVVAAVVPVVAISRGWPEALANVLLLQGWAPDPDIAYGMNGVAWSLSCEAFFYATCPLVFWLARRLAVQVQLVLAVGALGLGAVAALLAPGYAFHLPAARYGEFLVGVVAGLALRNGWRPRVPAAVAAVAVLAGLVVSSLVPYPLPNVVMVGPFLLVLLAAAGRDLRAERGWLWSRPLIFAGEASFALYLVHELVIINLEGQLSAPVAVELLVLVVVMCLAAVALHLGVERPCNRLLRGGRPSVALAPPEQLVESAHGDDASDRPVADRVGDRRPDQQ